MIKIMRLDDIISRWPKDRKVFKGEARKEGIIKSHWNTTIIIATGKNLPINAKVGKSWRKQDIYIASKFLLTIFIYYKGENSNFRVKITGRYHPNQLIVVNLTINETQQYHVPWKLMHWKGHSITSVEFLLQTHNFNLSSDKPKLRDILQSNWPVLFKTLSH